MTIWTLSQQLPVSKGLTKDLFVSKIQKQQKRTNSFYFIGLSIP